MQNQNLQKPKVENVATPTPVAKDETANWRTIIITDKNISFKVPDGFGFRSGYDDSFRLIDTDQKITGNLFLFSSDNIATDRYQLSFGVKGNYNFVRYNIETPDKQIKSGEGDKTLDQILGTFRFLESTSDVDNTSAKPRVISNTLQVDVANGGDWRSYNSNTGYYVQYPSAFRITAQEKFENNSCVTGWGNDAGGVITAEIVKYDGGSRRQLYGISPGYSYSFEDVLLQGYNSLIIEAGPIGDSGSGSGVVVPVKDKALIISLANRSKNSENFVSLLQSIRIRGQLNLENCGK